MVNREQPPPDRARLLTILESIDERLADVRAHDAALAGRGKQISDRFDDVLRDVWQSLARGVIGLLVGAAIIAIVRIASPTLSTPWPIALIVLGSVSAILGIGTVLVSWQARGRLIRERRAQLIPIDDERQSIDKQEHDLRRKREQLADRLERLRDLYHDDELRGDDEPPF